MDIILMQLINVYTFDQCIYLYLVYLRVECVYDNLIYNNIIIY
jgi:hypothetical protein